MVRAEDEGRVDERLVVAMKIFRIPQINITTSKISSRTIRTTIMC